MLILVFLQTPSEKRSKQKKFIDRLETQIIVHYWSLLENTGKADFANYGTFKKMYTFCHSVN